MTVHADGPVVLKADRRASGRRQALCLETQGREILAEIVHDEVDDAMRVGVYDGVPALDSTDAHSKARRR